MIGSALFQKGLFQFQHQFFGNIISTHSLRADSGAGGNQSNGILGADDLNFHISINLLRLMIEY